MPVYQYIAIDTQGKRVSGSAEASNHSILVRMLKEQGLIPTSINAGEKAMGGLFAKRPAKGKGGRVKIDDLSVLSRQMAVMIRAGLPLIEVLDSLSEQADKRELKTVLKEVQKDVEAGASFTEAIEKHPRVFNTFFVSMVKAGEASGMLDSILDQVAIYFEKTASIMRKIKSAIMYPLVVSIVAVIIVTFLLIAIVPVFEDIFADLEGDLPFLTQIILAASKFIQKQWYIAIGILVAGIFLAWQWKKTKSGRARLDYIKLHLPVFGPLFLKVAIARFTRTLGTLIRAGVNILYSLEIVARTSGNALIEEAIYRTRTSIQGGETITKPLVESGVFPPMVTRMIDVGERTGALESMLSKIADFYEDQVDAAVAGLTSLIEPLLIVFLGVVIGTIVIGMWWPLFKMIELVGH